MVMNKMALSSYMRYLQISKTNKRMREKTSKTIGIERLISATMSKNAEL